MQFERKAESKRCHYQYVVTFTSASFFLFFFPPSSSLRASEFGMVEEMFKCIFKMPSLNVRKGMRKGILFLITRTGANFLKCKRVDLID